MSNKKLKKIKNSVALGIYTSLTALSFAATYLIFHKYIVTNQDFVFAVVISGVAGLFEYKILRPTIIKRIGK